MRRYAIKDNASNRYLYFLERNYPPGWIDASNAFYSRILTFDTYKKAELTLKRVQRRLILESTSMYSALSYDLEIVEV